jgi:hypothetical protein
MTLVRLAAVAWQVFGPQADQAVMHNHVAHHSIEMRLLPPPRKAATCRHTCAHAMFARTEVTDRKQDSAIKFTTSIPGHATVQLSVTVSKGRRPFRQQSG